MDPPPFWQEICRPVKYFELFVMISLILLSHTSQTSRTNIGLSWDSENDTANCGLMRLVRWLIVVSAVAHAQDSPGEQCGLSIFKFGFRRRLLYPGFACKPIDFTLVVLKSRRSSG